MALTIRPSLLKCFVIFLLSITNIQLSITILFFQTFAITCVLENINVILVHVPFKYNE